MTGEKVAHRYTTVSCAPAAAKGAALMLRDQVLLHDVGLTLPWTLTLTIGIPNGEAPASKKRDGRSGIAGRLEVRHGA